VHRAVRAMRHLKSLGYLELFVADNVSDEFTSPASH
jgi:hypothetical protein